MLIDDDSYLFGHFICVSNVVFWMEVEKLLLYWLGYAQSEDETPEDVFCDLLTPGHLL